MKLIGNFLSPFARRVAVSLNVLGLPYEMEKVMVFQNPDAVAPHNPLVRIPTLVLDDGETVVESFAILDAIDQLVGPAKALVPASGAERRKVLKIVAVALGTMDKAQWAAYETRFHPAEKVHQPWIDHNDKGALGGLAYLDDLAGKAGKSGWLAGTPKIGQADISAAVAFSFAEVARPALGIAAKFPNIAAFAARCEATDAFSSVPVPK